MLGFGSPCNDRFRQPPLTAPRETKPNPQRERLPKCRCPGTGRLRKLNSVGVGASFLAVIPVSVKITTPPEKKTHGNSSFKNTKSRPGEQFLLQGCMAKARVKIVFVHTRTHTHT